MVGIMNNHVVLMIMLSTLCNLPCIIAMEERISSYTNKIEGPYDEIDNSYADIIYNRALENKKFKGINPFYEPLVLAAQALVITQKHGKNNGFESKSQQVSIIQGDGVINFNLPLINYDPLDITDIVNRLLFEEEKQTKRDLCNFIETVYYELDRAQPDKDDDTKLTYGTTVYNKRLNDIFPWVSGTTQFMRRRGTTGSPGSSSPQSTSPSGSPTLRKIKDRFAKMSPIKRHSKDKDNNNS